MCRHLVDSINKETLPEVSQWLPELLKDLEASFPEGYDKAMHYFATREVHNKVRNKTCAANLFSVINISLRRVLYYL